MVGQILVDKTKLTSGRILVLFVCMGCILGGIGVYAPLKEFAGAGATIPLTGFGHLLAEGVMKEVDKSGFLGVFTGGLTAAAGGLTAAVMFAFLAALLSNPREK